jgi:hypothetical protein
MDKVVPLFKSIFFKFFELGKTLFGSVKIGKDLNRIWIHLNFKFESNETVAARYCIRGPTCRWPRPPLFLRRSRSATTAPGSVPAAWHAAMPPFPPRLFSWARMSSTHLFSFFYSIKADAASAFLTASRPWAPLVWARSPELSTPS